MKTKAKKCDRCSYNEADPSVLVPAEFEDHYSTICADCESELHRALARQDRGDS